MDVVACGAHYAVWEPDGVAFASTFECEEVGCGERVVKCGVPAPRRDVVVGEHGERFGVVSFGVLPKGRVCNVHGAVGVHSDENGIQLRRVFVHEVG